MESFQLYITGSAFYGPKQDLKTALLDPTSD